MCYSLQETFFLFYCFFYCSFSKSLDSDKKNFLLGKTLPLGWGSLIYTFDELRKTFEHNIIWSKKIIKIIGTKNKKPEFLSHLFLVMKLVLLSFEVISSCRKRPEKMRLSRNLAPWKCN